MNIPVVLLTGGKSARFGSDKANTPFAGRKLVEQVIASFSNGTNFIVVGPDFIFGDRTIRFTRESPLGGGPVAALEAGIKFVESEYLALSATDIPFAGKVIAELIRHLPIGKDALLPVDDTGQRQPLCALYRVAALRKALAGLGEVEGKSMRSLISLLDIEEIDLGDAFASSLLDIDTPADLQRVLRLTKSQVDNEEGISDARLD